MRLSHKIIRLLEQPSIPIERIRGIKHCHSKNCRIGKQLIKDNFKTLIDVGANRGEFTKAFLYNFPNAECFTFEPLIEHYEKLKLIKNTTAYQIGLWNNNQNGTFFVRKDADIESSFLKPNNFTPEERKVELKRFDSLNINFQRPCYLKIDVEGAELPVLEGFGKLLKEIDIVQVEVMYRKLFDEKSKCNEVIKILEDNGFTGFIQTNLTYINQELNKPDKSELIFFKLR